jgi:diaminopropionate ammonia-lyase
MVEILRNPALSRTEGAREAHELLDEAGFEDAREAITAWDEYGPTPLVDRAGLARLLGVDRVWVKDESERFGLGSFKALGGAYAALCVVRDGGSSVTITCATDGNHGRAVAWGAKRAGARCVIYLHEGVSASRQEAIEELGAETVRVPGTYDDSFRANLADAAREGWIVVSDTSQEGRAAIPLTIMQGYRLLVEEALEQLGDAWPTHVFVQAGCGGLAAAVYAHSASRRGDRPPMTFVVVEPEAAASLYQSATKGRPVAVPGDLDTIMAGLAVGEASAPAWRILGPGADFFLTIPDEIIPECMRLLAVGADGDTPVVGGETGVAGLAGLVAVARDGAARGELGLDARSRVLLVNTEGDTAPDIYRAIVGRSGREIRAASPAAKVDA